MAMLGQINCDLTSSEERLLLSAQRLVELTEHTRLKLPATTLECVRAFVFNTEKVQVLETLSVQYCLTQLNQQVGRICTIFPHRADEIRCTLARMSKALSEILEA